MKSLVVYYSRTGKTRFVAEKIADYFDADIEEIIDKTDRSGKYGFLKSVVEAVVNAETEIESLNYSPKDYEHILLGCPVWTRKLPPAVRTYLKKVNMSEKQISFFNTNDSNENQNTFSAMKEFANNQNPVGKLVVSKVFKDREESAKKVEEWCEKIRKKLEEKTK